jgi:uncharacterized protein
LDLAFLLLLSIVVSLTCTAYLYGANRVTMYTLDEIKSILAKAKPELQKKYPLSELGIFGSYARGDADESSDIDVLVDFNDRIAGMKYITMAHEIAALFKTKVDVVSKGGIKPKYFKFVSEDLIYV